MTAEIFLSCFLGCLFAFVTLVVFGWQIAGFFLRRWFKNEFPKLMTKALTGDLDGVAGPGLQFDPQTKAMFEELRENAKHTPPGVTPHLSNARCNCGFTMTVPLELEFEPFLEQHGWTFDQTGHRGFMCPECTQLNVPRSA